MTRISDREAQVLSKLVEMFSFQTLERITEGTILVQLFSKRRGRELDQNKKHLPPKSFGGKRRSGGPHGRNGCI